MSDFKVGDRVKILDSTLCSAQEYKDYIGREAIIKKIHIYDKSPTQSDYDVAIVGEPHDNLHFIHLPGYNHSDLELVTEND